MGTATSKTFNAACQTKDDTLRHGCGQDLGRKKVMEDTSWARVIGGFPQSNADERSPNVRGFFVVDPSDSISDVNDEQVCDGHGGVDAADFTCQHLLKYFLLETELDTNCQKALVSVPEMTTPSLLAQFNSFLRVDAEFYRHVTLERLKDSGTTALAMAVFGSRVIIANAGDCRAILSRNGRARELTTDHRPNHESERQRIEAAGGFVDRDGYVCGDLGVSRALGDYHYTHLKKPDGSGPLIADPEMTEHMIESGDEFIVLVTDGVTDSLTNQTIIDLVRDSLRKYNCPEEASKALVAAAFKTGVKDNLTAMTICFRPDPPSKKKIPNSKSRLRIDPNSKSFADLLRALDD